jgi:arginase
MPHHSSLRLYRAQPISRPLAVLDVPLECGSAARGLAQAPAAFRASGALGRLAAQGIAVEDLGAVPVGPQDASSEAPSARGRHAATNFQVGREAAARVHRATASGRTVLALGGDHASAIGTIAGAAAGVAGELALIWIDAHGDIHTPSTSTTGHIHGMPLAMALGEGDADFTHLLGDASRAVQPSRTVALGLKDLDAPEIDRLERLGIAAFTMADIVRGQWLAMEQAMCTAAAGSAGVWVSLDLDSIEQAFVPGSPMATSGGLTAREVSVLCRFIGRTLPVVGIDLVEWAPDHDQGGRTLALAEECVALLLGVEGGWYAQYMEHEHL